jgi:hypothetical protein
MMPTPTTFGLTVCEQVIVDRRTGNYSPINIFTQLTAPSFPTDFTRLTVFATLTDTQGHGKMTVRCTELASNDDIYERSFPLIVPDQRAIQNLVLRVQRLRFPRAGWYEFVLLADDEQVAHRRFRVGETSASA